MKPSAPEPVRYKELKGWKPATPMDAIDRGAWWTAFKDAKLDWLESQVAISNQNIIASEAAYRNAEAILKGAQAGLFPTVTGNYSDTDSHSGSKTSGVSTGKTTTLDTFRATANALWTPDIWGLVRRQIESNVANSQFSAAELALATLSYQAQLATAYFNLRAEDALKDLLDQTAKTYQKTLDIAEHNYAAGTKSKADVAAARAQLLDAQSQAIATGVFRAQYEHAIAILIGVPPAELTIAANQFKNALPAIPVSLPSTLLERRPDIAAAERQMQQYNAQIGVAIAAYYPNISLSGVIGMAGRGALAVSLANEVWSIGLTAAQSVFDGGLRSATVDAARASYDKYVATYRQTVLTAFEQVEDELAALRILAQQAKVQDEAVKAAQENVDVLLNQYAAGTIAFTDVYVAQRQLLTYQENALGIRQNRFVDSVFLIQALGGGWDVNQLPSAGELEAANPLIPRL
jgi:NodT family efflux transporter outer membrane factor (OMF) lipoprotein